MRTLCSAFVVSCINIVSETYMSNPLLTCVSAVCVLDDSLIPLLKLTDSIMRNESESVAFGFFLFVFFLHQVFVVNSVVLNSGLYKKKKKQLLSCVQSVSLLIPLPPPFVQLLCPIRSTLTNRLRPCVHWLCKIKSHHCCPLIPESSLAFGLSVQLRRELAFLPF